MHIPEETQRDMALLASKLDTSAMLDAIQAGNVHVVDETCAFIEEDREYPIKSIEINARSFNGLKPREVSMRLRRRTDRHAPTEERDWPHDNRSNAYPERFGAWLEEYPELAEEDPADGLGPELLTDAERLELAYRWFGDDAKEAYSRLQALRSARADERWIS